MALSDWLTYRVKTLDKAGLDKAASELAASVKSYEPQCVIGIRSGGYVVAEHMTQYLPHSILLPITCRRPSTQVKQGVSLLGNVLRALPHTFTNLLRIAEHIVLTKYRKPKADVVLPDTAELDAIAAFLRQNPAARLLIVDDAVDSGATLTVVVNALRSIECFAGSVKTAAVTVTTHAPFTEPDFFLYRHVLCRFPWSLDAKE